MKKFLILPLLCLSMTVMAACSNDDTPAPETEQPTNPIGSGETRTLVAYFSAQGHTQAVAERITELLGVDIFRIEAADPYAENIPTMTATASRTRHTTAYGPKSPTCPTRKPSPPTTHCSSARPAGGTSPRWWSAPSSNRMTCRARS